MATIKHLISFHFLIANLGLVSNAAFVYRSYQKSVYCSASTQIQFPTSAHELQSIVLNAIAINSTVKVVGSLHSITDIICTEGIPVSTQFINYTIINHSQNTSTFGSGLHLIDALEILHSAGSSLIHMPAFGRLTIGGMIGTGAHGSSLLHPTSLSDQVVSVTLVDGKGKIRKISKDSKDSDEFLAISVNLGLLGALVDVTLKIVPLFKMTVKNSPRSEEILLDGTALAEANLYDYYQLCWFPTSKSVVVSDGTYTNDLSVPGNDKWNVVNLLSEDDVQFVKVLSETLQKLQFRQIEYLVEDNMRKSLYKEVPLFNPVMVDEEGNFVNPATGYAYNLLQGSCEEGHCMWDFVSMSEDTEIAFDVNELPIVVRKIKKILMEVDHPWFPAFGIVMRFARASDNLMSLEYGQDNVRLEWISLPRMKPYEDALDGLAAYEAITQAILEEHGGRPHWGKNGQYLLTKKILRKITPNLERFSKVMKTLDPNGIFMNKFGRRLMGTGDELSWDPEVTHCALQNYCFCGKDEDCAEGQSCEQVMKGRYRVCQDENPSLLKYLVVPNLFDGDLGRVLKKLLPLDVGNVSVNFDVLSGILG